MDGKAYVFNGDGDISEFITKVELYSAVKEYDDEKRAQNLASRLEGPAFDVYLRLDQDDRKNINKLKDELLKEFESGRRNREEAVCTLTKRYRKQGESAHTYAYKIKELVNLAYPDFENAAKSTLAKDQFVRGLHQGCWNRVGKGGGCPPCPFMRGSRGARSALFELLRLFCFTSRRIVVNDRHWYLTETAD